MKEISAIRFKDKVVVVTGAGSGIGEGIAEEFGKEGAMVVIAEINQESGKRVEQKLINQGIRAAFVQTDVSSEQSVISAVSQVANQWGHIDVLINNAWRHIEMAQRCFSKLEIPPNL